MERLQEIRDPIHAFIRLDSGERRLLDSRPLQRQRYIHQLAMTHLVYPGATHRRFEHSLGVMELATRIYDTIAREGRLVDEVRDELDDHGRVYWRRGRIVTIGQTRLQPEREDGVDADHQ